MQQQQQQQQKNKQQQPRIFGTIRPLLAEGWDASVDIVRNFRFQPISLESGNHDSSIDQGVTIEFADFGSPSVKICEFSVKPEDYAGINTLPTRVLAPLKPPPQRAVNLNSMQLYMLVRSTPMLVAMFERRWQQSQNCDDMLSR